jgi:hypothetical protein
MWLRCAARWWLGDGGVSEVEENTKRTLKKAELPRSRKIWTHGPHTAHSAGKIRRGLGAHKADGAG